MSVADGAAVASAVIALVAMLGSGAGWLLARREKNAAADHERRAADAAQQSAQAATRSADAGERAAAAQEAIAADTAAAAAADLEAPWAFERVGGIVWLLHNRLARRAYGVELSGHPHIRDGAATPKIDGRSSHTLRVINGEGDPMTVTWHWREDLTDEVPPWTGVLPR